MKQLLPYHLDGRPRYIRLNTRIDPAHSEMADAGAENIRALQKYARQLIESKTDTIDLICEQLI